MWWRRNWRFPWEDSAVSSNLCGWTSHSCCQVTCAHLARWLTYSHASVARGLTLICFSPDIKDLKKKPTTFSLSYVFQSICRLFSLAFCFNCQINYYIIIKNYNNEAFSMYTFFIHLSTWKSIDSIKQHIVLTFLFFFLQYCTISKSAGSILSRTSCCNDSVTYKWTLCGNVTN